MEHSRLANLLDSSQLFQAQVNELLVQQHHLCQESIGRMLALIDLPVSISWTKRRKGSTRYFQTNEEVEEQCRNVSGKENDGGPVVVPGPHLRSTTKASVHRYRRRRKPLVDSQGVNQSCQLDVREVDADVDLQEQQRGNEGLARSVEANYRGNEGLVHSEEGSKRGTDGNKSTFFAARENEDLVQSLEGKKSAPSSVSPLHITVAGKIGELRDVTEEPLPHLEKARSTISVSIGGAQSQVKTEVVPDLDAPRLTRNRAKILQNAGASVTIARGEPPLKKRRGRKGIVNSSDSPAVVDEDEIAGKMQTTVAQAALEQQSRDDLTSKKPPVVSKRNTRSSARSPPEKKGEVSKTGVTGAEQDREVVKMGNGPMKTTRAAEEQEDRAERWPDRKSRIRLNCSSQADHNAIKSENESDNVEASVEDHNRRENPATKRPRESDGIASVKVLPVEIDGIVGKFETTTVLPVEIDGIVGKFETMDVNQIEVTHPTTADQVTNALHPLEERSGMESHQESMMTPSPENGNAAELRIGCGSPKTSVIDLTDPDRGPTKTTRTAEEEEDKAEVRPSKKSRTAVGSTRLNSIWQVEANGFEPDKLDSAMENAYGSAKDRNSREGSATKRLRESNGNAGATDLLPSVAIDITVGQFETVGMNQKEDMHPTAAGDQIGNILHPLKEGNVTEPSQASMIKSSSQSGNEPKLRINSEVDSGDRDQGPTKTICSEEEEEAEGRPSKTFRTSSGSTGRNSSPQAEGNALELDNVKIASASGEASVDRSLRKGSAAKRSRERNQNTRATVLLPSVGIDGIVAKLGTVGMNQNEGMQPTAAADQVGNTHHLLTEGNGMESPQANMITQSSQNRSAVELKINCCSSNISEVCVADPNHVKPLRADQELVLDRTILPAESLASAEDLLKSLLEQRPYRGSRRTTLLLSPALKFKLVEREADVIVRDHPELKDEDTSFISEIAAEEQMEEQNSPQPSTECHPRTLSHGLAETDADANPSRTSGMADSVSEHSLAVELDMKEESKVDAIGAESTNVELVAVREASEWIEKAKDGISLFDVRTSPHDRDGDVVGQREVHRGPGTAVQIRKSSILSGEPSQTHITHKGTPHDRDGDVVGRGEWHSSPETALQISRSSILPRDTPQTRIRLENTSGTTPRIRERQLIELTTELHREESFEEENNGVRRETRRTLLLTAAEVHREELVDVEAGAVVLCSQLKINEGDHLFETSAVRDSQGGSNSHATLDVSHQDNRNQGELKVIIPPGVDERPSEGQDSRKETTASLENLQVNVSRVIPSVQVSSSNAQKPFSNLIVGMKSFVPVVQQPPPSFIPDGKRVVKVKALIAAEAAKRLEEEKRDGKDRLRKMTRRAEDNASSGNEKKEATETSLSLKESVEGSKCDGGESSCGSQFSPKKQALPRPNSRSLFSAEAKSKQATNLEIENKVKKNLAELKRMEEERRQKLLASRQLKEQLVEKKMEKRQEILKHKKEQKLVAEQEAQRHLASEETEREKKAMEEKIKSKQYSPRKEHQVEELKVRGAGQGVLHTGLARPGQTPGKIRSNLLVAGTLSSRSALRVPVVSKDKRTATMVAAYIQQKGRHPSSSSSSSKLLSLNAEPARLPSLNAESARLPSLNAEPASLSSLRTQCAAEGGGQHSTHALSLGNRPADIQQGRIGDNVSCSGTPCSRAVEKVIDFGPMSYEISPYRGSDDESEEEDREQPPKPAKYIPSWARKENLEPQLLKQLNLDPDEIFSGRKTCSLKEVFGKAGSKKIQDFGKRSGSGDWFKDRVSWKEELQYKIDMGYA